MKNKKYVLLFIIILFILFASSALRNAGTSVPTIFLADAGWDSIRLQNAIVKIIAEELFGVKIEMVPGTTPVLQQAILNGDVDINVEVWADNISTYYDDLKTEKVFEAGINFDDNKQGFYVPHYVIFGDSDRHIAPLAPDLKTVQDLNKYAHIFKDDEGSAKGRIYGAVPGWEIDEIMYKKYQYLGLENDFTYFRAGSESALTAAYYAAYEKGEAFAGYYWEPTWLKSKLNLVLLADEKYNETDFKEGKTEAPPVRVTILANTKIMAEYPVIFSFLQRYHTSSSSLSDALSYMQENETDYEETALWYIKNNPELVKSWLSDADYQKISNIEENKERNKEGTKFPFTISVDYKHIDNYFNELAKNAKFPQYIKSFINSFVNAIESLLFITPWWFIVIGVIFLNYSIHKNILKAAGYGVLISFVGIVGLWELMLCTVALIITAVVFALVFGFLIGILAKSSELCNRIIVPILDIMQTMPSFVYLIPAIMFFGLGKTPAVIATFIYSVAPMIRLTNLGLRGVSKNVIAAGKAFGATKLQILLKIEIPQAIPTIRTAVNQTIMMAVSMIVICSMVGANGLGMEVMIAVNRSEIGRGIAAGFSIVIIAIIFDRLGSV